MSVSRQFREVAHLPLGRGSRRNRGNAMDNLVERERDVEGDGDDRVDEQRVPLVR